jgi:hypothetical protein
MSFFCPEYEIACISVTFLLLEIISQETSALKIMYSLNIFDKNFLLRLAIIYNKPTRNPPADSSGKNCSRTRAPSIKM